jgi:hypothetical protein
MKQHFWKVALSLAIGLSVAGTATAEDTIKESRSVDANVSKVYLDGVVSLELHQGPNPSVVVYGSKDDLKALSAVQSGDTFRIDTEEGFFIRTPRLHIEMTLPNLSHFTSSGIGPAHLSGFSGDNLQLNATGAGAVNIRSNYKHVVIRSTGVATMNVDDGDSDKIELIAPGAGHIVLIGQTKEFISRLDGVGGVDAKDLKADNVTTYLNGVGSVKVYAKKSANMYLHGVGSVTVYGNPATRNSEVSGFGKINWE